MELNMKKRYCGALSVIIWTAAATATAADATAVTAAAVSV